MNKIKLTLLKNYSLKNYSLKATWHTISFDFF